MVSAFIGFFKALLIFFPTPLRVIFIALVVLSCVSFVFHLIKLAWGLVGK